MLLWWHSTSHLQCLTYIVVVKKSELIFSRFSCSWSAGWVNQTEDPDVQRQEQTVVLSKKPTRQPANNLFNICQKPLPHQTEHKIPEVQITKQNTTWFMSPVLLLTQLSWRWMVLVVSSSRLWTQETMAQRGAWLIFPPVSPCYCFYTPKQVTGATWQRRSLYSHQTLQDRRGWRWGADATRNHRKRIPAPNWTPSHILGEREENIFCDVSAETGQQERLLLGSFSHLSPLWTPMGTQ